MNKVKSFKEFINESIWGDIHKRSSGIQIKKEDMVTLDTVDDYDVDGLYKYMIMHYECLGSEKIELKKEVHGKDIYYIIKIPITLEGDYIESVPEVMEPGKIYGITLTKPITKYVPKKVFDYIRKYTKDQLMDDELDKNLYDAHSEHGCIDNSDILSVVNKALHGVDNPAIKMK